MTAENYPPRGGFYPFLPVLKDVPPVRLGFWPFFGANCASRVSARCRVTGNRDAGPFHMTLIPMKPYPLRDAFADKHNGQKGNFFNQES